MPDNTRNYLLAHRIDMNRLLPGVPDSMGVTHVKFDINSKSSEPITARVTGYLKDHADLSELEGDKLYDLRVKCERTGKAYRLVEVDEFDVMEVDDA